MGHTIGALVTEHIAVGVVEQNELVGAVQRFPDAGDFRDMLEGMPAEEIVRRIGEKIESVGRGLEIDAVGVGFPGINRGGLVEDSPNLKQTKGLNVAEALSALLAGKGIGAHVH